MAERTANPGSSSERGRSQAAGVVSASFAALATLIAAISYCLPVLSLALAAGGPSNRRARPLGG